MTKLEIVLSSIFDQNLIIIWKVLRLKRESKIRIK